MSSPLTILIIVLLLCTKLLTQIWSGVITIVIILIAILTISLYLMELLLFIYLFLNKYKLHCHICSIYCITDSTCLDYNQGEYYQVYRVFGQSLLWHAVLAKATVSWWNSRKMLNATQVVTSDTRINGIATDPRLSPNPLINLRLLRSIRRMWQRSFSQRQQPRRQQPYSVTLLTYYINQKYWPKFLFVQLKYACDQMQQRFYMKIVKIR